MIQWEDKAIVLAVEPYGERLYLVTLLCAEHGLRRAMLRQSGRHGAPFQPGECVLAIWRGRHENQLGTWRLESVRHGPVSIFSNREALLLMDAALSLTRGFCYEGVPHMRLFGAFDALLLALEYEHLRRSTFVHFEMCLLDEAGLGLALDQCAVTGETAGLAYISPRTGHAVTRSAADGYQHRMLPLLPVFHDTTITLETHAFVEALHVTGHFLEKASADMVGEKYFLPRRSLLSYLADNMTENENG